MPVGRVNGGGKLKPPAQKHDEEGYKRDWAHSGLDVKRTAAHVLLKHLSKPCMWVNAHVSDIL